MRGIVRTVALMLAIGLSTSGCATGVDGPVVAGKRLSFGTDTIVAGTIAIEGDCLYLLQTGIGRYPVIWPPGTSWDGDKSAVVLPDGTPVGRGEHVEGTGGYHTDNLSTYTSPQGVERVTSCVDNEYGEVAVFNSIGEIEVSS